MSQKSFINAKISSNDWFLISVRWNDGNLQGLCVPIQCPPGYEPGALPLRHFNEDQQRQFVCVILDAYRCLIGRLFLHHMIHKVKVYHLDLWSLTGCKIPSWGLLQHTMVRYHSSKACCIHGSSHLYKFASLRVRYFDTVSEQVNRQQSIYHKPLCNQKCHSTG